MFDPNAETQLVRPAVTADDAVRVAREAYGINGTVTELGSNQDRNFLLTPRREDAASRSDGTGTLGVGSGSDDVANATGAAEPADASRQRFLLKFDNEVFSNAEIEAQNFALLRLAERGVLVPTPVLSPSGDWISEVADAEGRTIRARLLTFVEGESLVDEGHLFPRIIEQLGRLSGRVVAELTDADDPALDRDLQWDMRNAMAVVEAYAHEVDDDERRDATLAAAREAWARIQDVADELPVQPIHGDLTDDNVVGRRDELGRVVPECIIDFGDLALGWRVAEIAVTVSSVLHHQPGRPLDAMHAVRAFAEQVPLDDAELRALWPLVVLRGAVLVVSGAHQVALEPENDYARERMAHEWRLFREATSVPFLEAEAAVRAAVGAPDALGGPGEDATATIGSGRASGAGPGPTATSSLGALRASAPVAHATGALGASRAAAPVPLIPTLSKTGYDVIRLDPMSRHLHRGAWLEPGIESSLAGEVTAAGRFAVFAYGEHRLTRAIGPGTAEPVNAALVTEVWVPATGATIAAPFDGIATATAERSIAVAGDLGTVTLRGARSVLDGPVTAGAYLGSADPGARLEIAWCRPGVADAPAFADATHVPAWRRLTLDPAALLGVPAADWLADPARERERRASIVADAAERYFEVPPQIERGWRELLVDTTGRTYVDMVNNVSGIGHGHPRLADALHEQFLTLSTNSRFLYRKLADYVERLVELAPDPSLSVVFLVNSGSEAVDLAVRLAQVHTDRRDVLALREGYHGWTYVTDAVSTSAFDNPNAVGSRPEWVHLADAVNPYRGTHTGADAGARYAADLEAKLGELDAAGRAPGAFLCEPVFGNGGGIVYPDGYLRAAYASVRRRGGVCISDEVQVGLGRLGAYTWGCQQQAVVPDILVVAKALGNGYPLGAVYTTPEIAASLSREGMFFSSAGGAIGSAAAGLAVLDVMRDEQLQQNAQHVGEHLRSRIDELATRHALIGRYHGMGLYGGIELVRDRTTKEPAAAETAWICERLLDFGVIMNQTSERRNVLKVKPPLCLTIEHADVFVDALDAVLGELEVRG